MISSAYGFIFLHAPKTAGNSMQLVLQPFSDDRISRIRGRDPTQQFGLKGPVTTKKHAKLQDYARRLGSDLAGRRVVIATRDPVMRAVSLYFSPHFWQRPGAEGETRLTKPSWDLERFLGTLERMDRLVDFLLVDGALRKPDMVIRYEQLASDFEAFARTMGLPIGASDLPHANASAAGEDLHRAASRDPAVRTAVEARFAADYEFLETIGR